jgi:hypothetical protein
MTGKEAANVNEASPGGREQILDFLTTAPARELQQYIHNISVDAYSHWYQRARTALDIRLAEDAGRTADKLARFTRWLICFTVALVFIGIVQIVIMFLKP